MAFFKTLKNNFNKVYVNGVISIYKKIKLMSYQFYWTMATGITLPVSKGNGSVIPMGNGSNINNMRLYYLTEDKIYMYTGYAWATVGTLPVPYYFNGGRRGALASFGNSRLYFFTCSASNSQNNRVYYLDPSTNTWTDVVAKFGSSALTPYNMYNAAATYYSSNFHVFGGGTESDHLKHYIFDQSSWTRVADLPKDLCKHTTAYSSYAPVAIKHNGDIHYIGYCQDDNMIYDIWFNDNWDNPTLIAIKAGAGYDNYIFGAFEDNNGVLYAYTQSKMYKFNDATNTWSLVESNYIGQYTRDSIAYFNNPPQRQQYVFRMQNSNMYFLSVAYKLRYEE